MRARVGARPSRGTYEVRPQLKTGGSETKVFSDAFSEASRGFVKMVAAERGVSPARVYRQAENIEPTYGVMFCRDLDRLLIEGAPDPFAELRVICQRYSGEFIQHEHADDAERASVLESVGHVGRLLGEVVADTCKALDDGKVDSREADGLRDRVQEAQQQLATFLDRINAQAKDGRVYRLPVVGEVRAR